MKKILSFVLVAVLAVMLSGCNKYDDSDLQRRVSALETSMSQLTNYQALLQVLAAGNTVTSYTTTEDGYKLIFSNGSSIEFNAQGPKGDTGKPLTWDDLTQAQKDALQGAAGEPGKTPKFKIENETWKVSYDDGKTWSEVGSAIDRSLIEDIALSSDGTTVIITLADGTEIPVAYGEKEGFGFEIGGGRKGFCVLEDLESLRSMQLTVPYTITGNAEQLEDVSVVVLNIQTFEDPWRSSGSIPMTQWETEEISPGSGNIILSLDRIKYDDEMYYGYFDDPGEIMYTYPTLRVDVVAFFPDGTSAHRHFYSNGVRFTLDDYNQEFSYNASYGPAPYEEVEASSTSFPLWVRLRLMNRNFYDGPALTPFTFSDIFSETHSGNMSATVEYATPTAYSWHNDTEIGLEYPVTYKYGANTTGKERKTNIAFYRKISSNIGTGFFFLYLIQAAH